MDEIKAQADLEKASASNIKNQTNVQINDETFVVPRSNLEMLETD